MFMAVNRPKSEGIATLTVHKPHSKEIEEALDFTVLSRSCFDYNRLTITIAFNSWLGFLK